MPVAQGGLTPLALGLFHPYKKVRFAVVDLFERIEEHPVPPLSFHLTKGWPTLHRRSEQIPEIRHGASHQ